MYRNIGWKETLGWNVGERVVQRLGVIIDGNMVVHGLKRARVVGVKGVLRIERGLVILDMMGLMMVEVVVGVMDLVKGVVHDACKRRRERT